MHAFWTKYASKLKEPAEKEAFKLIHKELHKAMEDYAKGEYYCDHIANMIEMCEDFLEVKGYLKGNLPATR